MKLTKEHIIAYLPYNVECSYKDSSSGKRIKAVVTGWTKSDGVETTYKRKQGNCHGDCIRFEGHNSLEVLDFKLSLRPLTDLYKNLPEHEEIMDEFSEYSWEQFENAFFVLSRCNNCFDFITYSVAKLLFKHHFDVFGLNEKKI